MSRSGSDASSRIARCTAEDGWCLLPWMTCTGKLQLSLSVQAVRVREGLVCKRSFPVLVLMITTGTSCVKKAIDLFGTMARF